LLDSQTINRTFNPRNEGMKAGRKEGRKEEQGGKIEQGRQAGRKE
jgi:hypothetical protein